MGVLGPTEKGKPPQTVNNDLCMSCGQCAASCPTGALEHSSYPAGSIKPVNMSFMPSAEQVLELMRTRRSVRSFEKRPVDRETLQKIIQIAAYAPTGHNSRSVEFVVVQDKTLIKQMSMNTAESLDKIIGYTNSSIMRFFMKRSMKDQYYQVMDLRPAFELVVAEVNKGNDVVFHDAPTVIAFVSDPKKTSSEVNSQLAIQNSLLACDSLGLGGYYCGFASAMANRDPRILSALKLDPNKRVDGIIALGYPKLKLKNWIEREAKVNWI